MDASLRATLLDLARYVECEREQLQDGIRLYMDDGLTADQKAELSSLIKQRGQLRHQRADEIEEAASRAPGGVAAIIFKAARLCRSGDPEATSLLEQAAAEWQTAERTPADSKAEVHLSPAEQDIVDVIREAGGAIDSQTAIFNALAAKGKIPSEGTTKTSLAAMVRHGILQTGPGGKGYKLPS
jgi:hypothetical protein